MDDSSLFLFHFTNMFILFEIAKVSSETRIDRIVRLMSCLLLNEPLREAAKGSPATKEKGTFF